MNDTITLPRAVVEQAFDAIELGWCAFEMNDYSLEKFETAKTALRAALEQSQVEQPVAWMYAEWSGSGRKVLTFEGPPAEPSPRDEIVNPIWSPLYTRPQPKRQPLTDAEILMVLDAADIPDLPRDFKDVDIDIARAIEAAHGIGE